MATHDNESSKVSIFAAVTLEDAGVLSKSSSFFAANCSTVLSGLDASRAGLRVLSLSRLISSMCSSLMVASSLVLLRFLFFDFLEGFFLLLLLETSSVSEEDS